MPPKPTTPTQPPNYLLKITLCKTSNPTVTRLISVPAFMQFHELHLTIAAAFGWTDPCTAWLFRLWTEDTIKHCDQLKYKGSVAIYWTQPNAGFDLKPAFLKNTTKISDHFQKFGRFWTHDFGLARFSHAIEVVDTIDDDQKGKIGCLGGQGAVGRRAWQFADLEGLEGVIVGAKSTWDFDMGVLNGRLRDVQDILEKRIEGTKEKATEKAQKALARKETHKVAPTKPPSPTARTPKPRAPRPTPPKPAPGKPTLTKKPDPPEPTSTTPTPPTNQPPPFPPKKEMKPQSPKLPTTSPIPHPTTTPPKKRPSEANAETQTPRKRRQGTFRDNSNEDVFKPEQE